MKVVIVGGGFGGVRAALRFANKPGFEVRLISDKTYFEYHAALYRSATGRSPLEVAIPLREFFSRAGNVEVVHDTVERLDAAKQMVMGQSKSRYKYDTLIVALGNVTQYFGIKGLEKYSYGVKTIQEALKLKRHLHDDLLRNALGERRYVVVGGGATGVELAAEMTAYLRKVRKRHGMREQTFTIDLVEAAPRVMPMLPKSFSARLEKRLRCLGVKLHMDSAISAETFEGVTLPEGKIKTDTVVWTAGVANHPFFAAHDKVFRLGKHGRVVVDHYLSAAPGIFVIGDNTDTTFAGMAQTALYDADFVADHVQRTAKGRKPRAYKPKRPVYAIPAGPHWSAVLWGRIRLYGFPGWVLRRLADLRLYLLFLSPVKALTTWRYGVKLEEQCDICKE